MLPAFDIPAFAGGHSSAKAGFKILNAPFLFDLTGSPAVQIKKYAIAGAIKERAPFDQKFDRHFCLCISQCV
jgi:hypothetical protein